MKKTIRYMLYIKYVENSVINNNNNNIMRNSVIHSGTPCVNQDRTQVDLQGRNNGTRTSDRADGALHLARGSREVRRDSAKGAVLRRVDALSLPQQRNPTRSFPHATSVSWISRSQPPSPSPAPPHRPRRSTIASSVMRACRAGRKLTRSARS